jgi:hypothetical protein
MPEAMRVDHGRESSASSALYHDRVRRLLLILSIAGCAERALPIGAAPPSLLDAARPDLCNGNSLCPPDQYCDYAPGECAVFEAYRDCVPRPTRCAPDLGGPVCGCDKRTYASECELHRAGVPELHEHACP